VTNDQGGGAGVLPLSSDDPYVRRLELAHWLKLRRAGRYLITATTQLELTDGRTRADMARSEFISIAVSVPIEVIGGKR
jgi:hypothetical protein